MNENKENMVITEQDVFNFVFFKESVPLVKQNIIGTESTYKEMMHFYTALKNDSTEKIDESLKKSLASKIAAYSLSNVIHLNKLKDPEIKQNGNRLAADSKELKPKMTTKTFVDNEKEYLIKVLNYGDITKVFVFSTKDEVVKNFDIVIEPNNIIYHFEDNSEPLKIDKPIETDSITLRFI